MKSTVYNFYDSNAHLYDGDQENFGFIRVPEKDIVMDAIRKSSHKGQSVLEIGAGTGRFTLEVAPLVKQVTAVDLSPRMLALMSEKMKEKGVANIRQVCGNFLDISFDEKFDLIIGVSAIEYIKDKKALFRKISGLLAPGGRLILTTAHDTFFRFWGRLGNYFRQGIFMNAFRKGEMRRLLAANGLHVKQMTDLCMKSFFTKGVMLFVYAGK